MRYPYKVHLDRSRWHELRNIIEWCNKNFGEGGHPSLGDNIWILETAFGNSTFAFSNSQDATYFVLMWK